MQLKNNYKPPAELARLAAMLRAADRMCAGNTELDRDRFILLAVALGQEAMHESNRSLLRNVKACERAGTYDPEYTALLNIELGMRSRSPFRMKCRTCGMHGMCGEM